MGLIIGDNFNYQGKKSNFERDSFQTLLQMKSYPETSVDEGHLSYCEETDKYYKFKSTNVDDPSSGKWSEFTVGSEISDKIDQHISDNSNPHSVNKQQIGLSNVTNDAQVKRSEMGVANGVATLNENGKIPVSQLDGQMAKVFGIEKAIADYAALPADATEGQRFYTLDNKKIYERLDGSWDSGTDPKGDTIYNFRHSDATGDESRGNILYRWDGENMSEISSSIAIGETAGTAYEGNKGKAVTDSLNLHKMNKSNPHNITKAQIGLGNVDNTSDVNKPISNATQEAIDQLKTTTEQNISAHTSDTSNPHQVTKNQLGLDNVDNTSDADKPISNATQTALDSKIDKDSLKTINGQSLEGLGNIKVVAPEFVSFTEEEQQKIHQVIGDTTNSLFKGQYETVEDLNSTYPTADAGSYAYVGNPRHMYTFDTGTAAWKDFGEFDYNVDQEFDDESTRAIANKKVTAKLSELEQKIDTNSADIADMYRESTKSNYDEIVKDHYYKSNGEYTAENYNSYSVAYYNVSAGDKILVKGTEKGINVASISFVSAKGEKAISTFDISESLKESITVNRCLLIPEGVNYVALSVGYTDYYRLSLYKVTEESRIDKRDKEIDSIKEQLMYGKETVLVEDEIDKGHYYGKSGNYLTDSYGFFNIKYYSVTEGQKIRLLGKYKGTIYAFVLLENKRETAIYKYGISNSVSEYSNIDEIITIPNGINWIAMSYAHGADTAPYLVKEVEYLGFLNGRVTSLEGKIDTAGSNWRGKRLLAIGDSITAPKKWQEKVGQILGMNVRTHAKGGIGLVTMVDGDGSETPPNYDPDDFGTSVIYPLNSEDVRNVDIIAIMGAYNERKKAVSDLGSVTDVYQPNSGSSNSFCAKFNHVIDRVYEELNKINNTTCKIVLITPHKYGKYPYSDESAYDDGEDMYNAFKLISDYHSLPLIDLMHGGNINKYNWNNFQSSNSPYNNNYIPADGINDGTNKPFDSLDSAPSASENEGKYITVTGKLNAYKSDGSSWVLQSNYPAPWNGDQLHLNTEGYYRIGEYIAGQINAM